MTIADLAAALETVGAKVKWRKLDGYYREEYPDAPAICGLHAEMPNGWTLSIAWAPGCYSNLAPDRTWRPDEGPTYEAAAFDANGKWFKPPTIAERSWYDVLSYATVEEIAVFAKAVLDAEPSK